MRLEKGPRGCPLTHLGLLLMLKDGVARRRGIVVLELRMLHEEGTWADLVTVGIVTPKSVKGGPRCPSVDDQLF